MKQDDPSAPPQVFAVKRRSFLQGSIAATVVTAAAGCSDDDDDDDPLDPFTVGGVTYRVIALPDYNAVLPESGKSLTIVAFIKNDFYFRAFDAAGQMTVNQHESKVADKAALTELKTLTHGMIGRGRMEPAEQARLAELASTTASGSASGRRMQGTETSAQSSGRRMQGSNATGQPSGRRMQGAEGRPEATAEARNLGTLEINGQKYENSRIVAAYTDGYSRVAHSAGEVTVRSDALPQIVQMQLPIAVPNPTSMPSALPRATVTTPSVTPAPAPSPSPPRTTGGGHYWRPN